MFLIGFSSFAILAGTILIELLVEYDARDPTIFVSGFWLGSFCGAVFAAYFILKGRGDK